jgi:hypothetical protein
MILMTRDHWQLVEIPEDVWAVIFREMPARGRYHMEAGIDATCDTERGSDQCNREGGFGEAATAIYLGLDPIAVLRHCISKRNELRGDRGVDMVYRGVSIDAKFCGNSNYPRFYPAKGFEFVADYAIVVVVARWVRKFWVVGYVSQRRYPTVIDMHDFGKGCGLQETVRWEDMRPIARLVEILRDSG